MALLHNFLFSFTVFVRHVSACLVFITVACLFFLALAIAWRYP
jgi:hypothetical protein